MARKSNTPPNALVSHVQSLVGDDVSEDQINRVIVAYQAVYAGAPVGTVMINPETGDVARRVAADGVHKWQVIGADGVSFDTRPDLEGWDVVRRPE